MTHKVHMLKTWPVPFEALRARVKRFEFRKDDRDYEVGDTLWLSEFDPETGSITGENEVVLVTYLLREGFGIPPGYVVMSIDWPVRDQGPSAERDELARERSASKSPPKPPPHQAGGREP